MHYDGSFMVTSDRAEAYKFATDPSKVAAIFPDVSDVVVQDANHFSFKAKVGISSIKGVMNVKCTVVEKVPLTSVKLKLSARGLSSAVELESTFSFQDSKEGGTVVKWAADAVVAGPIASLGSRFTDSVAEKYTRRVVKSLERELSP